MGPTRMRAAGVPLHTVSELLGHSSVAVTGDVQGHVANQGARFGGPAVLSSNGLVRMCAVATPMATRQPSGASDLSETASGRAVSVG